MTDILIEMLEATAKNPQGHMLIRSAQAAQLVQLCRDAAHLRDALNWAMSLANVYTPELAGPPFERILAETAYLEER